MKILDSVKDFSQNVRSLADGIQQAEGWANPKDFNNTNIGSKSYRYHNPGNLFGSIYEGARSGGYSIFENDFVGYYALCHQIQRYFEGHLPGITDASSLRAMLSMYTGLGSGKELDGYLKVVHEVSGFSDSLTLGHLK